MFVGRPLTIEIEMIHFFEQLFASLWNRLRGQERGAWSERGSLDLGSQVSDGEVTGRHRSLSNARRTMHIAVLGKTGSGKSSFLRYLAQQDIAAEQSEADRSRQHAFPTFNILPGGSGSKARQTDP